MTLTPRKTSAEHHRQDQPVDRRLALVGLRRADAERHRQRAADQDDGVERAPEERDRRARGDERVVIPRPVEHVGHEQATEEQDFGEQEGPHAEDGSLLLLPHRLELMLQRRMVRGVPGGRGVRGRERRRQTTLQSPSTTCGVNSYGSLVTRGVTAKFSVGGGDDVSHSRPDAPHGFGPATAPLLERLQEVEHRQHVADAQHRGAGRRHDVEHLELWRVGVIAARHAEVAHDELREERQVEADEDENRAIRDRNSEYIRPVIFGHQKCRPPR